LHSVVLTEPDDFEGWRDAARALVLAGVAPDRVVWSQGAPDLFATGEYPAGPQGSLLVPRACADLARSVVCHSDPERFALLYTLLWRLQVQRTLIDDHARHTGSPLARRLLDHWGLTVSRFVKVMPTEYKRALQQQRAQALLRTGS
jgi:DNA polymerase